MEINIDLHIYKVVYVLEYTCVEGNSSFSSVCTTKEYETEKVYVAKDIKSVEEYVNEMDKLKVIKSITLIDDEIDGILL